MSTGPLALGPASTGPTPVVTSSAGQRPNTHRWASAQENAPQPVPSSAFSGGSQGWRVDPQLTRGRFRELLPVALERDLRRLDEGLYLDVYAQQRQQKPAQKAARR